MVLEFRKAITLNNIVYLQIDGATEEIEILAKYSVGKKNTLVVEVFEHNSKFELDLIKRVAEDSFRTNDKLVNILGLTDDYTKTTLIESVTFDSGFQADVYCTNNENVFSIMVDASNLYVYEDLSDIGMEDYVARDVLAHFVQSDFYADIKDALNMGDTLYITKSDLLDWIFDGSDECDEIKKDIGNEVVDAMCKGETYTMDIDKYWDSRVNRGAIRLGSTLNHKPFGDIDYNETELDDMGIDYRIVLV